MYWTCADSTTYLTLIVGMMYLGLTPFPLSTRNSAAAVTHLVRSTGIHELLVSSDAGMQRVAQEAKEELEKDGYRVDILPMPEYGQLYNEDAVPAGVKTSILSGDNQALIIHSSGNVDLPCRCGSNLTNRTQDPPPFQSLSQLLIVTLLVGPSVRVRTVRLAFCAPHLIMSYCRLW